MQTFQHESSRELSEFGSSSQLPKPEFQVLTGKWQEPTIHPSRLFSLQTTTELKSAKWNMPAARLRSGGYVVLQHPKQKKKGFVDSCFFCQWCNLRISSMKQLMSRSNYHKLPEMDQASATPASAAASRINASCDIKSEIFCSAPWLWFDDVWCSQDAIIIKSSSPLSFSSSSLEDKSCNVAGLVVQTCRSTTGIRDQHQSPRFRCFGETFMVGSCIS